MGDYFEKLVALWLQLNDHYQHIQQRLTVYYNERTIGEFDFIFTDHKTGSSQHWEVAVKFYLEYFDGEDYQFLGPNAKDSLDKKMIELDGTRCAPLHAPGSEIRNKSSDCTCTCIVQKSE